MLNIQDLSTPGPTHSPLHEAPRRQDYIGNLRHEYGHRDLPLLQEGTPGHGPQSSSHLSSSSLWYGHIEPLSNIAKPRRPNLPVYHTRPASNNFEWVDSTPSAYLDSQSPTSLTGPLDQRESFDRALNWHQPISRLPSPPFHTRDELWPTHSPRLPEFQLPIIKQSHQLPAPLKALTLPVPTLSLANTLSPLGNARTCGSFDHDTQPGRSDDQHRMPSFGHVFNSNNNVSSTGSEHNRLWNGLT